LDVLEQEKIMEQVRAQSAPWHESLCQLVVDFPRQVLAVRGQGYLVGVQVAGDPAPLLAAMRARGLLAPSAGGNVVRLLPPLTATAAELAKSVEIFRAVLTTSG